MKFICTFFLFFTLTVSHQTYAQSALIRYVKQNGVGDGSSWSQASGDLQGMISASSPGDQVWVAMGEYLPESGQSFIMKEGVQILGGFPKAGNPMLTDRDWNSNETILRGNGNSVIKNQYNNLSASSVLDGFTVTGGHAFDGGGIYNYFTSPTYINLSIIGNSVERFGGGVAVIGLCTPIFRQTTISQNKADDTGGGVYNRESSAIFEHVTISDNTSVTAGGVYNIQSFSSFTHVTIINNEVSSTAGGVLNQNSPTTFEYVTISGNKANGIGGIFNVTAVGSSIFPESYSPILRHVIISNNTAEIYVGGIGNTNSSPILNNVKIIGNLAKQGGGGMENRNDARPIMNNVLISGNVGMKFGGGVMNYQSSPIMNNVTISGNYALHHGSGMVNTYSSPVMTNSIVWGNLGAALNISTNTDAQQPPSGSFNLIEGPLHGGTNISGDFSQLSLADIFVSHVQATSGSPSLAGDFRLKTGSPAINIGANHLLWQHLPSNESTPEPQDPNSPLWGTDLEGQHRVKGEKVDLGAYESSYANIKEVTAPLMLTVAYGTDLGAIEVPDNHSLTVKLSDGRTVPAIIDLDATNWTWMSGGTKYDPLKAGVYVFKTVISSPDINSVDWYTNMRNLEAEIQVTVLKEIPQISATWNGSLIDPKMGLIIPNGEEGKLVISNTSTDDPEITLEIDSDLEKILDISSLSVIRALGVGQGLMKINLSETDNFEAATLTIPVEVTKALIKGISFSDQSFVYDGSQKTLEINGVLPAGTSVNYENNGRTDAGSQTVTANIKGNEFYLDLNLTAVLSVTPAPQLISHNFPVELRRDAVSFLPTLTATSGLSVSVLVDDPDIASWSGTELRIHQLGTVAITLTQAGGGNYLTAEPVTVHVRIVDPSLDLPIMVRPALSPNGDGINDYLIVEGIKDFAENRVVILNRNGNIVWESKGYDNVNQTFRGISHKGNQLANGTYFYLIEIKINGQWQFKKGYFVLRF